MKGTDDCSLRNVPVCLSNDMTGRRKGEKLHLTKLDNGGCSSSGVRSYSLGGGLCARSGGVWDEVEG